MGAYEELDSYGPDRPPPASAEPPSQRPALSILDTSSDGRFRCIVYHIALLFADRIDCVQKASKYALFKGVSSPK